MQHSALLTVLFMKSYIELFTAHFQGATKLPENDNVHNVLSSVI